MKPLRPSRTRFVFLALLSACVELPHAPGPTPPAKTGPRATPANAGLPPSEPATTHSSNHVPLRVGSWNVRRLGLDERTDIPLLARLIDRHFDLIAILEVMRTEDTEHIGYDKLISALGPDWAGQITDSPRPDLASPFAEYYAVLRRVERVAPCPDDTHLTFHPDADGRRTDAGAPDLFLREPAFGCYHALAPSGATGFDFVLGVYHARWGSGDVAEIASEVRQLNEVLHQRQRLMPSEKDLLLVGDFNLETEELQTLLEAEDITDGEGSTVNSQGQRSNNLLDHVLVANRAYTSELITGAQVLDLRAEAGPVPSYAERLSDHLPLRALFRVDGEDDD